MFSPATKKSPMTPLAASVRRSSEAPPAVPNRPSTGTPAPWSSRLSVLARIQSAKRSEQTSANADRTQPVYVSEFPQPVRDAQSALPHGAFGAGALAGGMDRETSLAWIICGDRIFLWSHLSSSAAPSNRCSVLEIPPQALGTSQNAAHWMVSVVRWDVDASSSDKDRLLGRCTSTGVVICNQKTRAVVYWPDIYSEGGNVPIVSIPSLEESDRQYPMNSMIVSGVSAASHECVAIACQSNGMLWQFRVATYGIYRERVSEEVFGGSKGYPRSLVWHLRHDLSKDFRRTFLLLTNDEIQCWNVTHDMHITKLWAHRVVGDDGDSGIKKDLAGQKHIWLLDLQVDEHGKEFSVLVATHCKDRVSSSSYTQYSLLTMHYKPGRKASVESGGPVSEPVLEKKAPLQVIIPKASAKDENFLFSMRLRVGGKPSGSAVVLSGDGTATVTNYWRGSTRLYQFDLPWDAGKVLDASVFPSAEDTEEGAWVVLTEKAGVWAIPEKAVLLGGVEPPERSLSRKGSSNEGAAEEEKRSQAFGSNIIPRRVSSDAWGAGDRQRASLAGVARITAQDEEAEALLGRLFHDFLVSGEVEGAFEKLRVKGAFEKDGETNVFARLSRSIVDVLAKHWTTTRGAEFVASAVVSSLLSDKQQKHQNYLQFIALSKCHEELSSRQRGSLLTIMEHGEKLFGMVQLRELQNMFSQNRSDGSDSPSSQSWSHMASSLWDLIQLVGEKARRNTVLLMDRDNAEVFYSKVSVIEELFNCLSLHLPDIIGGEQPFKIQMQRAYELANACTTVVQAALRYRCEHQTWYPSPDGLTPWNCQAVVRSGLWSIASFIMQLLKETTVIDMSTKSDLWSQIEALTDILLDGYTGSITSKIERGEEHKSLRAEYHKRTDELLGSLYELAKRLAEAKYQDSYKDVDDPELKDTIFRELVSPILSIAKRHEGYQTLWDICYDLSDTVLLRSLMHDSVGPKGGFSNFVFKQLVKRQQYAKLLRLGEEFQEELASFLKDHKDLLCLHQIFLHQFSSASETFHAVALSQDDGSGLVIEEEREQSRITVPPSLADRRRLLNLSKIAAAAGKGEGYEMKMRRIEADLHILNLQEEIFRHFPDCGVEDMNKPLPPGDLVKMCLEGESRDLSLLAFEVFAWTSSSFQSTNRKLLVECWKNAADQDDWAALCQASAAEGWSDEVVFECLKKTILYKASNRCYGPEAETYNGDFDDFLPLQKEDMESPDSSVEGILMHHKDFPDAGKLMLTAIMMGKVGDNIIAEEEDLAMDSR